jgi:hypothetical protein
MFASWRADLIAFRVAAAARDWGIPIAGIACRFRAVRAASLGVAQRKGAASSKARIRGCAADLNRDALDARPLRR